jgi:hypothetical protein
MDVVPYIVRSDGHWITNRITDALENTNPEGFNQWLDERDPITGRRLVEVIRLMKYLRDFKQRFSMRSVVLSSCWPSRSPSRASCSRPAATRTCRPRS